MPRFDAARLLRWQTDAAMVNDCLTMMVNDAVIGAFMMRSATFRSQLARFEVANMLYQDPQGFR
jgi:hypothetical protein